MQFGGSGTDDEIVLRQFLLQDAALWSLYLLYADEVVTDSDLASYRSFLSWLIAIGRDSYLLSFSMDAEVLEAWLRTDALGRHDLMLYLAAKTDLKHQVHDLRQWFYSEAIYQFRLAPFLTAGELLLLGSGADRSKREPGAAGQHSVAADWAFAHIQQAGRALGRKIWETRRPRVAIAGFHRSVLGLGEDARCLFDSLCEIGIVPELIDLSPSEFIQDADATRYRAFEAGRPMASIVIFCMPAFEMMRMIARLNLTRPRMGSYWIGYWPWETTALRKDWNCVYDVVDEIWAPSTFLETVYREGGGRSIYHIPPHIAVPRPCPSSELTEICGSGFVVLNIFDFNSRIERKNPAAAIAAFRSAFPRHINDVRLVFKTINGDRWPDQLAAIMAAIGDDDRILVIDGSLERAELSALIARADIYLSLHRAEGFGRPLVEAMLLGTPVIATAWSGAADFLDETTGYPIGSALRPVQSDEYSFAAGVWAEPDVGQAAEIMRRIYDTGAPASLIGTALRMAQVKFGRKAAAANIMNRLEMIQLQSSAEAR